VRWARSPWSRIKRIYDACEEENTTISTKEIAENVGVSSRAIEMQIAKFKTNKIIKRIGPAKGGYWEVVGK